MDQLPPGGELIQRTHIVISGTDIELSGWDLAGYHVSLNGSGHATDCFFGRPAHSTYVVKVGEIDGANWIFEHCDFDGGNVGGRNLYVGRNSTAKVSRSRFTNSLGDHLKLLGDEVEVAHCLFQSIGAKGGGPICIGLHSGSASIHDNLLDMRIPSGVRWGLTNYLRCEALWDCKITQVRFSHNICVGMKARGYYCFQAASNPGPVTGVEVIENIVETGINGGFLEPGHTGFTNVFGNINYHTGRWIRGEIRKGV